jgi:predicted CoA-substrate-specific enzyme activase
MIGYVCKYTPVELLESMGAKMELLEADSALSAQAECCTHPNQCAFARGIMAALEKEDCEGIVLTTCCDSVRRLYDVLKDLYPHKFIAILDLPRKAGVPEAKLYSARMEELIHAYEQYSGKTFDPARFYDWVDGKKEPALQPEDPDALAVGILGARHTRQLEKILAAHHAYVSGDLSCAAQSRIFHLLSSKPWDMMRLSYAVQLLGQLPCMRMCSSERRRREIEALAQRSDGLIYHTVKFCDLYSYEYASVQNEKRIPVLKMETDFSTQAAGQMETRVEAFLESLEAGRKTAVENTKRTGGAVMGIDSGSSSTCAVIMDRERHVLASALIRTGAGSVQSAEKVRQQALEKAGLKAADIARTVSTGYGRVSIPFADAEVTEITCHARGARYYNPEVRTILDIGGQDSKAIRLNEKGDVVDFAMNDKCAAGTGRFLENMAKVLEVPLAQLGDLSMRSTHAIEITSQCTVFAESEVVSLVAQNEKKEDIIAALHRSVASRACALLKRVNLEAPCMMSGGVALNKGMVKAVEEKTGMRFSVAPDPEIVGAVGACLAALDA